MIRTRITLYELTTSNSGIKDDNRMAAVAVAACNGVCWAGGGNEAW